jgi:glycosyltransferase involved in cell wall biosynthesis
MYKKEKNSIEPVEKDLQEGRFKDDKNDAIAVVMCTHNGGKSMYKAIESISSQKDVTIELIIVDDCSTSPLTKEILQILPKKYSNTNLSVRIIHNEVNIGPGKSRDIGIHHSKSMHVAILDDDDVWENEYKLLHQKEFLDKHTEYSAVGTDLVIFVNEQDEELSRKSYPKTWSQIYRSMLVKNPLITSAVMFKKEVYLLSGGFSDMYLAEDYDLWLRFGMNGKIANISGAETRYTVRAQSASKKKKHRMNMIVLKLVWKYRKHYPLASIALVKCLARFVRSVFV